MGFYDVVRGSWPVAALLAGQLASATPGLAQPKPGGATSVAPAAAASKPAPPPKKAVAKAGPKASPKAATKPKPKPKPKAAGKADAHRAADKASAAPKETKVSADKPGPPAEDKAPQKPVDPIEAASALLDSGEEKQVAAGLKQLSALGKPACVPPIVARLERGLPPRLSLQAMEALALLGDSRAHRPLIALLAHRRPALRSRAADTLGAMHAGGAHGALVALLDDPEPSVRAAAIAALGSLGNRRAFEPLREALAHGEASAAPALGAIATGADVKKLVAIARDLRFGSIEPALQMIAARSDIPVGGKVSMVNELGKLDDPAAETFLKGFLDGLPEKGRQPLMKAISKALQRMRDRAAKARAADVPPPQPSAPPEEKPDAPPAAAATPAPKSSAPKATAQLKENKP